MAQDVSREIDRAIESPQTSGLPLSVVAELSRNAHYRATTQRNAVILGSHLHPLSLLVYGAELENITCLGHDHWLVSTVGESSRSLGTARSRVTRRSSNSSEASCGCAVSRAIARSRTPRRSRRQTSAVWFGFASQAASRLGSRRRQSSDQSAGTIEGSGPERLRHANGDAAGCRDVCRGLRPRSGERDDRRRHFHRKDDAVRGSWPEWCLTTSTSSSLRTAPSYTLIRIAATVRSGTRSQPQCRRSRRSARTPTRSISRCSISYAMLYDFNQIGSFSGVAWRGDGRGLQSADDWA